MTTPAAPVSRIDTNPAVYHDTVYHDAGVARLQKLTLSLLAALLACLLAGTVGIAVWWLARRFGGGLGPTRALTVRFPDARGVRAGDDVTLAGVMVGKVETVTVDADGLARARLQVAQNAVTPPGSRYIAVPALFGVSSGVRIVPPPSQNALSSAASPNNNGGDVVNGEAADDVASAFARLNAVAAQMERVGGRSEQLITEATGAARALRGAASDTGVRRDVTATLADTRSAARAASYVTRKLARLVDTATPASRAVLENAARASMSAASGARDAAALVADARTAARTSRPALAGLLADTRKTARSASQLLTKTDALLPAPPVARATVADLADVAANLKSATAKLDTLAGSGRDLLADPTLAADIKETAHSLRSVVARADKTLANAEPVTADPSAAADVRETLRSVREVAATSAKLLDLLAKAAAKK